MPGVLLGSARSVPTAEPPLPIPQLAFQRTYAIQSRDWSTDLLLLISVISGRSSDFPITRDVGDDARFRRFPTPPGLFSLFVANKSTSANPPLRHAWVALGWPLRGPWVAQGWPKGDPIPSPSRQKVAVAHCRSPTVKCLLSKTFYCSHPEAQPEYSQSSQGESSTKYGATRRPAELKSVRVLYRLPEKCRGAGSGLHSRLPVH